LRPDDDIFGKNPSKIKAIFCNIPEMAFERVSDPENPENAL